MALTQEAGRPTAGPMDYYLIEYPAGQVYPSEAVRETLALAEAEIVRVVDVVVVQRDDDGELAEREVSSLNDYDPLRALAGKLTEVLTSEDVVRLIDGLAPNTSAVIFVIEHLWAASLLDTLGSWNCSVSKRGPIRSSDPAASRGVRGSAGAFLPRRGGRPAVVEQTVPNVDL